MHVYIIGSGAIGKALAVSLMQEGKAVTLIRGREGGQPSAGETITFIDSRGERIRQELVIRTWDEVPELNGVVAVATKTFANEAVAQNLRGKKGRFAVVLLQNGLNIEAAFADFPDLYRCVLFSTSLVEENGDISFRSVSPSPLGAVRHRETDAAGVVQALHTDRFAFREETEVARIAWEKAIINCAYNSICPLLEVDNGIFSENDKALGIARSVIRECVELAGECGVALEESAVLDRLLVISRRSKGHLISTYQDLLHGRETEIGSLNLEMARLAREKGRPGLTRLTESLGEMILIRSALAGRMKG